MGASPRAGLHPHSLPVDLSPLVGRETELDQVLALIDDPARRLITLTGPGGVGKSRLALHISATLVREFDRDVRYVPLASIRDDDLVVPTIRQVLGLAPDANVPDLDRITEALQGQSILLVLDNFEQILGAAPAVALILARCPEITVLVTSQAPLGLVGEQLYPLSPLPTPSPEQTTAGDILRTEAVALFVDRARAVSPNMIIDDRTAITIADICRRLDGLPLAIELAAARTNILSPHALLARLSNRLQVLGGERRDIPERWRTMRHAIAWSYDLLTPPEQHLFRHLAVFSGGFSFDAVESINQPAANDRDVYAVLGALVDHSLVQTVPHATRENRFRMLETLREYGLEQLAKQSEAPDAHLNHARWCMALAEESEPGLTGNDQEEWLDRLDAEWDNIRTAGDWSLTQGQPQIALRIFGAAWRYCSARGLTTECRRYLGAAIEATADDQSTFRTRGLVAAGNLAQNQGDLNVAQEFLEQARGLAVAIGHPEDEIQAMIGLAKVAVNHSDYATAIDFHQRAADLARRTGDQRAVGVSLGGLAYVAYFQGRLDDAVTYWEEARQVVATVGDHLLEAVAASNLGAVAKERGEYDKAEKLLTRALDLQRRMQAEDSLPYTLTNLGETWNFLGDHTLAEDLLAEAVSRFRDLGYKGSEGTCLTSYALVAIDRGDEPRAAIMLMEGTRLIHEAGDQFPITENADLLAEICANRGAHGPAIELMTAAAAIRADLDAELKPVQLARVDAVRDSLRQAVSSAEFERYRLAGAACNLDCIVRRITIIAREVVGTQHPQPLLPGLAPPETGLHLTNRELEVLRLLMEGRSTREISDALFISPRTATTHISNIFGKLEVSSRAAAVAYAMRNGLV